MPRKKHKLAIKGRPPKDPSEQRVHKVTVSFTKDEYEQLQTLAGHEPVSTPNDAQRKTARPRRQFGSIAGHIRAVMQQGRQAVTPEQLALLNQLVDQCNLLTELAQRAESVGLLALSVSMTTTQQRMNRLLDTMDRQHKLNK